MSEFVLRAAGLEKSFSQGPDSVTVLTGVELSVARGERVAVIGRSGSGKSTLLHLLGGLDEPDAGEVWVGSENITAEEHQELRRIINRKTRGSDQ